MYSNYFPHPVHSNLSLELYKTSTPNQNKIPRCGILEQKKSSLMSSSYRLNSDEHLLETSLKSVNSIETNQSSKLDASTSPKLPVFSFTKFEVSSKIISKLKVYTKHCQTSMMELFSKKPNC